MGTDLSRKTATETDGFIAGLMKWDALLGQRVLDTISFAVPAFLFSAFVLAPKAGDLQNFAIQFAILGLYVFGAFLRLVLNWNRLRSFKFQVGSALFDIIALYAFLLIIPLAYATPAAISLKAPTKNLLFIFIIARIVLFDLRLIFITGLAAAIGWAALTAWTLVEPDSLGRTRDFTEYMTSNKVLIGAQVEQVLSLLMVTLVSAAGVNAYQRDGLTGLRKRREFLQALKRRMPEHAEEGGSTLILLRISNWDELARSNKSLADRTLQDIAAALLKAPVKTFLAARYEAGAIMFWKRGLADDAALLNHLKLLHSMALDQAAALRAEVHIGAALVDTYDDEMVRYVLAAVDRAPEQTEHIQICDSRFVAWCRAQKSLTAMVHDALQSDAFEVYHQPIVDMLNDKIVGTEALLRLKGPDGRHISPAVFIPIAEKVGAIDEIGAYVLDQASSDNIAMKQAGVGEDLFVSVNVAPIQLQAWTRLKQAVSRALDQSVQLKLELTESLAAQNGQLQHRLNTLKQSGALLAIDDFGTGYSSLERLGEMPFDTIKIDLAFTRKIHTPNGFAMIDAIVRMAKASGKDVIIEGIETSEDQALAMKAGIRFGQGFYFRRPVSTSNLIGAYGSPRGLGQIRQTA